MEGRVSKQDEEVVEVKEVFKRMVLTSAGVGGMTYALGEREGGEGGGGVYS